MQHRSGITNQSWLKATPSVEQDFKRAGIPMTQRQLSKYRRGKGEVYNHPENVAHRLFILP